jgi:hypothetical protein
VALTPALFPQATDELARQERIGDRAAATGAQLAQRCSPRPMPAD